MNVIHTDNLSYPTNNHWIVKCNTVTPSTKTRTTLESSFSLTRLITATGSPWRSTRIFSVDIITAVAARRDWDIGNRRGGPARGALCHFLTCSEGSASGADGLRVRLFFKCITALFKIDRSGMYSACVHKPTQICAHTSRKWKKTGQCSRFVLQISTRQYVCIQLSQAYKVAKKKKLLLF